MQFIHKFLEVPIGAEHGYGWLFALTNLFVTICLLVSLAHSLATIVDLWRDRRVCAVNVYLSLGKWCHSQFPLACITKCMNLLGCWSIMPTQSPLSLHVYKQEHMVTVESQPLQP